MAFRFLSYSGLKRKILLLGTSGPVIVGFTIILSMSFIVNSSTEDIRILLNKKMEKEISLVCEGIYNMVKTQDLLLRDKLEGDLAVASNELETAGGLKTGTDSLSIEIENQYTKEKTTVTLPRLYVGNQPLKYTASFSEEALIVDKVKKMVGGTATIFQRINENGDMLRVATNVMNTDKQRAVGTFIPAVNPGGEKNKVIETVLSGRTYIGRAYVVDKWYITAYNPVKNDSGDVTGILYVGLPQESVGELRKAIENIKVGDTGYAFVIGGTDTIKYQSIIHPEHGSGKNFENIKNSAGENIVKNMVDKAVASENGQVNFFKYGWKNPGEKNSRAKIAAVTYYEPWGWVIAASTYEEEFLDFINNVNAIFKKIMKFSFAVVAVLVLLTGAASFFTAGRISKNINSVVESLKDIAMGEGDLTKRMEVTSKDELGALAHWFNVFVEKIQEMIKEITSNAVSVSSFSGNILDSARNVAKNSKSTLEKTTQVLNAAENMNTTNQSSASSMEQASSNLNSVSAAAEQMDATIKEIAENAEKGREISSSAMEESQNLTSVITKLDEIVSSIGSVTQTINDISDQTNLLALNATIEAARAGDAGKGFAVVASEIKELASQTSASTVDIRDKISEVQSSTDKAVSNIEIINKVINELEQVVSSISAAIEQQAAVTSEISNNISQAAQGVMNTSSEIENSAENSRLITNEISCVNESVREITRAGESAEKSSKELSDLAEQLKAMVERFRV